MKTCKCLLTLLFCLIWSYPTYGDELKQLRENYSNLLLSSSTESQELVQLLTAIPPETELSDQMVVELHQRYPLNDKIIKEYISTLLPNGSWEDINYQDTKRSGWAPMTHAKRVLEMTKAFYTETSSLYRDKELERALHGTLSYWFTHKPQCLNWWYNQIGVPKTLGSAFILFFDELSHEEKELAIAVMNQARFGMTGQNKVWLAGNVLIRAVLQEDMDLMRKARNVIAGEITLGQKEGIQEDWSFHQHGPQQQFGNYGLAFLTSMSFYSSLFTNTSLAFDDAQLKILNKLIQDGYAWVIWNGKMDINALGRQLFHNVPIHKGFSVGFAAIELAQNEDPILKQTKQSFLENNFGLLNTNLKVGHKHFWKSDYTLHRRPHWMASLKMSSERVIGSETVNEDNQMGYYMGDGALYVYTDIRGYLNSFPFWDWRKIPGITAYDSSDDMPNLNQGDTRNHSELVGGFTLGDQGLSVMELNRDGLTANKLWLFSQDYIFCLGGNITSNADSVVTTSIDQRIQQDQLYRWNHQKWSEVEEVAAFDGEEIHLHQGDIGYIVVNNNSTLVSQCQLKTGDWHDNMGMYTPNQLSERMFTLYLDHGKTPQAAAYAYYILPNTSKTDVQHFDSSTVKVLQNDNEAQILYLPRTNQYWGVTLKTCSLSIGQDCKVDIEAQQLFCLIEDRDAIHLYLYDLKTADSDQPSHAIIKK